MTPTRTSVVADFFRHYSNLYQLRNNRGGELSPEQEKEWKELSFTIESIFSGLYRPDPDLIYSGPRNRIAIRAQIPVDYLRVPTETDVLCETPSSFFSGRLQDISTGGAYIHARVPFEVDSQVRLTFCTFREEMPLELEGRVAWNNPGGMRKRCLPAGAGVEWIEFDETSRGKLQEFVYELVEETLARANLL